MISLIKKMLNKNNDTAIARSRTVDITNITDAIEHATKLSSLKGNKDQVVGVIRYTRSTDTDKQFNRGLNGRLYVQAQTDLMMVGYRVYPINDLDSPNVVAAAQNGIIIKMIK